jgi:hypothetical protein
MFQTGDTGNPSGQQQERGEGRGGRGGVGGGGRAAENELLSNFASHVSVNCQEDRKQVDLIIEHNKDTGILTNSVSVTEQRLSYRAVPRLVNSIRPPYANYEGEKQWDMRVVSQF